MKRVSLADVARAAGVGKATASRALSGNDEVGEATRARIRDIADSMGYAPHRSAQSLRTGRSGIVALFLTVQAPWAGEVMQVAAVIATGFGHHLLVGSLDELDGVVAPAAQLSGLGADGVCLVGASRALADRLAGDSVPGLQIIDGDVPDPVAVELAVRRICRPER